MNDRNPYTGMDDEQLILLVRDNNADALDELFFRYVPLVTMKAASFASPAIPADDFSQEGMLALLAAVRRYDSQSGASFKTFASICVKNRLLTVVKNAGRKKHSPLSNFVPLDSLSEAQTDGGSNIDPEELFIRSESRKHMEKTVFRVLSEAEIRVLTYYLNGMTYNEIAKKTGVKSKTVDNSMQKIRKKLKTVI